MLIGFKCENFRSFLTEQSFSFSTSADRMHESTHLIRTGMKSVPRVSKAAIVFGPNASGKTNLLIALATLRDFVMHSHSFSELQLRRCYTPFRFGPAAGRPTAFELDVLLGAMRYRYSLAYDSQRIMAERLLVYRTGKSQRWFDRRYDAVTDQEEWTPFSPHFNGPRESWRRATGQRASFLSTAARLGSKQLAPLLNWVTHCVEIVLPTDPPDVGRLAARIQDESFKAHILDLLRAAGIQVADVRVAEGTTIEFLYKRSGWAPTWLNARFEASGTHRLMGLFAPLLDAMEHGKLLLVDEFDTSLHPLVARFLVQRFNDPAVSRHGAQLLLTSHNTTLMDLDYLRRDEIWLVELDDNYTSNLSPLQRASPRKNELVAKNYLKGRYGAVPQISLEPASDAPGPTHRSTAGAARERRKTEISR